MRVPSTKLTFFPHTCRFLLSPFCSFYRLLASFSRPWPPLSTLNYDDTTVMDEDGQLERFDSEFASMSSISSTLSTDDFRNLTSSGDISSISSGSGEIPPVSVLAPPFLRREGSSEFETAPAPREKCVGRSNKGVSWGHTSVIGRRKEMEDAVSVMPGFMSRTCDHVGGCTAPGSRSSGEIAPLHFFGVYDGHGGSQNFKVSCAEKKWGAHYIGYIALVQEFSSPENDINFLMVAKFCAKRMHDVIAEEWDREMGGAAEWQRRWELVFANSFERTDNEILSDAVAPEMVGSTASVVVLSGCQIITSNCGDSRVVLCRRTQTIPLTVDQKPDRQDELLRIEGGGGKVINWNGARVFGVLAMSRAIGDRYLRPWIIPVPEITFTARTDEDECLVLASDGLWDVMTNEEVGEVARRILRRRRRSLSMEETSPAQVVAESLTEMAYGRNSKDNISIIVVDLKSKRKRQQRPPLIC